MEAIAEILTRALLRIPEGKIANIFQQFRSANTDNESYGERQARNYNMNIGDLPGFYCEKCKNKGMIAYAAADNCRMRECSCMQLRRVQENMSKSGLGDLLGLYTFENYDTPDEWRKIVTGMEKIINGGTV